MAHPFSEEEYRKSIVALENNKAVGRDDVLVEQLKHLVPKANRWLQTMLNYRPISLFCHTYKQYEQIIIYIIAPVVEQRLIKEQADLRTGKSCTSQLLNLTQHIEEKHDHRCILRRHIPCLRHSEPYKPNTETLQHNSIQPTM